MIEISFPAAELILAAVWLAFRIAVWIRNRQIRWKREAVLLLMYVNLAVLLRITFFPMARVNGHVQPLVFDASAVYPFWINRVPFVHLFDFASRRDLLVNVIGNAAMFVPSGIIPPVVYRRLDRFPKVLLAGAGLSVPITGFANSIAAAAIEFKSEGLVLGMAAKMFVIAGPVLVYGMAASVLYGLIYWVVGLF